MPFLLPQVSTMAEMKSYSQAVTGVSTACAYVCVGGGGTPMCDAAPGKECSAEEAHDPACPWAYNLGLATV